MQKWTCESAYRKAGKNTVHCMIQTENGGKWDFCAHQYLCLQSNRYELSKTAAACTIRQKHDNNKE